MSRRFTLMSCVAGLVFAVAIVPVATLNWREASNDNPSSQGAPLVGAYAPVAQQGAQRNWDIVNQQIGAGKLTYRRSFDNTIPPPGREAWRAANARLNIYSVKPPGGDDQGFVAGRYDGQMQAMVRALPKKTLLVMYHEPEDDMPGAQFAALTKKTVSVVRSVRSDVKVWYVAMAFQWESNSKGNTGGNAGWIDAAKAADGVALDVYSPPGKYWKLSEHAGFTRWWKEVKEPSGKPWGITERGIATQRGPQARIQMLRDDWSFVKQNGAQFFLYWNANNTGQVTNGPGRQWTLDITSAREQWTLNDPQERAAFQAIAAERQP